MNRFRPLFPAALAASALFAQDPWPPLKAQYDWGYASPSGQGKGTLSILLDPAAGRTIVELEGLGERLVLLEGNARDGYRLRIPRRQVDQKAGALGDLVVPFLPQVGSPEALYKLLTTGEGAGVKVTKRDKDGPVKLQYEGKDEKGKELTVWLARTRWEKGPLTTP